VLRRPAPETTPIAVSEPQPESGSRRTAARGSDQSGASAILRSSSATARLRSRARPARSERRRMGRRDAARPRATAGGKTYLAPWTRNSRRAACRTRRDFSSTRPHVAARFRAAWHGEALSPRELPSSARLGLREARRASARGGGPGGGAACSEFWNLEYGAPRGRRVADTSRRTVAGGACPESGDGQRAQVAKTRAGHQNRGRAAGVELALIRRRADHAMLPRPSRLALSPADSELRRCAPSPCS
jgi:hypothetical protein